MRGWLLGLSFAGEMGDGGCPADDSPCIWDYTSHEVLKYKEDTNRFVKNYTPGTPVMMSIDRNAHLKITNRWGL